MQKQLSRKYSSVQNTVQRIVIGVAGGSAAGKTTFCNNINRQMIFDRNFKVQVISLDCFYKNLQPDINPKQFNFDHPNAIDFDLACKTLQLMIESHEPIPIPQYSFVENKRLDEVTYLQPANIILFQGLMVFHDPRIRKLLTYKIFIQCDDDIRLCRRLKRDVQQRGRTVQGILNQYSLFVKDAFHNFILPSSFFADITIPGFRNNRVAIDFIVQQIKNIAKRINFKQKVTKTKIFFFGQTQYYDLQYNEEKNNDILTLHDTFIVFATADEHKKQLNFFINNLLMQYFTFDYFNEVFRKQFIRIMIQLVQQLIQLQRYNLKDISICSYFTLLRKQSQQLSKVTLVFMPIISAKEQNKIMTNLSRFINRNSNSIIILCSVFCYMQFPKLLYQSASNHLILINLSVLANEKRFRQMINNNMQTNVNNLNWIDSNLLAEEGAELIAKQLNIMYISQQPIFKSKYLEAIAHQKQPHMQLYIDQSKQVYENIRQINVFCQQHQNLCGFHVLSNILCLQKKLNIFDRNIFIQHHTLFNKIIKQTDYQPLERSQLDELLHHTEFKDKHVIKLYYCFNYVQNSTQQIQKFDEQFSLFFRGQIQKLYIILGVFDHFTFVQINSKKQIKYFDSGNTSLRDIMTNSNKQWTQNNRDNSLQTSKFQAYKNRKDNIRQALQIICKICKLECSLAILLVEKRIEQIILSYNSVKDNQNDRNNWLKNEYPKQVIENDLLKEINKIDRSKISAKNLKLLTQWQNDPIVKNIMGFK